MAKSNNTDKINSLQRHIDKLNTHQTTRTGSRLNAYKTWVKLEISRTEKKLASLK